MSRTGPASVMLFWDYDTQWGGDRSRAPGGPKDWGHLEFENTVRLLELQAQYEMPSCFAVVGSAALPGTRPYHDPAQIREIHQAGHEIASHTHRHEWVPGLNRESLHATLRESKDALEQCIGAEVSCFVPPYNQPFDYLQGWSISLSERREAGKHRTDLWGLCEALQTTGYRFCRVGYRSLQLRLADRLLRRGWDKPSRLERIAGVDCLRTNACGFDTKSLRLLNRCVQAAQTLVIYGHPHSLSNPLSFQRFELFERFLAIVSDLRRAGKVRCLQPRDLVAQPVPGLVPS